VSWIDDIRASSMHSVVNEDSAYTLRYIFRWYSRTFATPLHVVESLPMEDVLRTYYEVRYEEMEEHDREAEIARLIEPEEKLKQRRVEEDYEEADLFSYAKEVEEEERRALAMPKPKKADQSMAGVSEAVANLSKAVRMSETNREKEKEEPPPPPQIEPEIHMKFIETDEEFEEMLEGSFGPPPRPKR
jgi:hypothetical protein